ncbi:MULTISPECIES: class I SAM-dependent DNA methyltransferase [Geobacter]|uniref:Methyltransferase type 11 n=2 Tax=Geobacter TaxID=28231 RepID=A0A0C1TT24_9BACT|nr:MULTISPECIES: class I SAM-dependent methyltransferase [Geobacter]KIE42503.1 methyltransferase type 11 [Geobacter soli]MBE2887205.1 class I SAM-dependent methyltransferase [Geobacter anodireducens]
MTVFNDYSRYYDLLYRDKDYTGEADFVARMIRAHHPSAARVLELGCGTGRHAELLVQRGFALHGVDRSEGMLKEAHGRKSFLSAELAGALEFSSGDVRDVRLGVSFDVVISLFHVMSYQTSNADLDAAFATAAAHLEPGGLFLFDFWYGPAVLAEMPEVRVKRLADTEIEVTRIAEPLIHPEENCVTVNYEIGILNKSDGTYSRFNESHRMRYLFLPEINALCERHGMVPVFSCEWMSGKVPGLGTWSVCTGARVMEQ